MTVLSRLEAVLEPTKRAVLDWKLALDARRGCHPRRLSLEAGTPCGPAIQILAEQVGNGLAPMPGHRPQPPDLVHGEGECNREMTFAPGREPSGIASDRPSSRQHRPTASSRTTRRCLGRLRRTTGLPHEACPIARRSIAGQNPSHDPEHSPHSARSRSIR